MKKTISADKLFSTKVEITQSLSLADEVFMTNGIVIILTDDTVCFYDISIANDFETEEYKLTKYSNMDEFLKEKSLTRNSLVIPDEDDAVAVEIIKTIFKENLNYNLKDIYFLDWY